MANNVWSSWLAFVYLKSIVITVAQIVRVLFKVTFQNFGKYTDLLSCHESDEIPPSCLYMKYEPASAC